MIIAMGEETKARERSCRCWMNVLLDWQPQTEQTRRYTAKPQKPLSHGPSMDTVQLPCAPNSELSNLHFQFDRFLGIK